MAAEVHETPAGPLEIETAPGVHGIAPSTLELARRLDVRPGERVLELGCGAGLLAVAAARLGAGRVVAIDIDEAACRATAANARRNGARVETRRGDFLEAVRGERFDLVLFNPPQTPGPRPFGPKWGGEDGARHLRAVLPRLREHLRPGGRGLLLVLSLVDERALEPLLAPFRVEARGETGRELEAAEYEGYCPGLVAYLAARAGTGLRRTGPGRYAFRCRYLRLRLPPEGPRLVVNADDLGADRARNEGIREAFERGIVRSASLLANGPAFDDAVRTLSALAASRFGPLDVGLHLNLSEGGSLTGMPFAGTKQAAWDGLARADAGALEAEVRAQLARLRSGGLAPTHLDGHQHVHAFAAARRAAVEVARAEGLFLRIPDEPALGIAAGTAFAPEVEKIRENGRALHPLAAAAGVRVVDAFRGLAAARAPDIEERALENLRASLAHLPGTGVTELMVHPARLEAGAAREGPFSSFATPAREAELRALADPSWPDWLAERGIALASFGEAGPR